jgi:16S rRNA (adenine1518-N6/adenine1519-N6)-dimethyltransferase
MKVHKAKKSLGQNFLKSELALREIIKAGEIKKEDIILEIGPGKGALTERLLENSDHVIAIEKDRELFAFLQEKFKEEIMSKKLLLLEEDILLFSVKEKKYKVIANIPYNITGAILKKFLTEIYQPDICGKHLFRAETSFAFCIRPPPRASALPLYSSPCQFSY